MARLNATDSLCVVTCAAQNLKNAKVIYDYKVVEMPKCIEVHISVADEANMLDYITVCISKTGALTVKTDTGFDAFIGVSGVVLAKGCKLQKDPGLKEALNNLLPKLAAISPR